MQIVVLKQTVPDLPEGNLRERGRNGVPALLIKRQPASVLGVLRIVICRCRSAVRSRAAGGEEPSPPEADRMGNARAPQLLQPEPVLLDLLLLQLAVRRQEGRQTERETHALRPQRSGQKNQIGQLQLPVLCGGREKVDPTEQCQRKPRCGIGRVRVIPRTALRRSSRGSVPCRSGRFAGAQHRHRGCKHQQKCNPSFFHDYPVLLRNFRAGITHTPAAETGGSAVQHPPQSAPAVRQGTRGTGIRLRPG